MARPQIYPALTSFEKREIDLDGLTAFQKQFSRWLLLRLQMEFDDVQRSEDEKNAICDEFGELTMSILLTPAPSPYVIYRKFEILRQLNVDEQVISLINGSGCSSRRSRPMSEPGFNQMRRSCETGG